MTCTLKKRILKRELNHKKEKLSIRTVKSKSRTLHKAKDKKYNIYYIIYISILKKAYWIFSKK